LDLGEHGEIVAVPLVKVGEHWKKADNSRSAQSWRARVEYCGTDGIRRDASVRRRTRREAEEAIKAEVARRLSGGSLDITANTLLLEVGEAWLKQVKRTDANLAERTVKIYEDTYRRYVDVNGSPLRGLTISQANSVQRIRGFLQTIADRNGSGAARTTKTVLSGIFEFALSCDALSTNAARQIRPPKANKPRDTGRDRTRSLTREERRTVIDFADKLAANEALDPRTLRKRQAVADLIAVMAGTGTRIGEARDLRWEHVHLAERYVNLHGTKSRAARRRLDLPDWLANRLEQRIEQQAAHYRHGARYAKHTETETRAEVVGRLTANAEAVGVSGYLFPSPAHLDIERPWDQSNSANAVRSLLDAAGMGWAVGHTFRRTVATLLGEAGIPLAQIADQLGHEDPAMTASVYLGRDFEGDKSALAAVL